MDGRSVSELGVAIKNISGGEWWKSEGEEVFTDLAKVLIDKGFTQEEAVDFLSSAFSAVSAEYGD